MKKHLKNHKKHVLVIVFSLIILLSMIDLVYSEVNPELMPKLAKEFTKKPKDCSRLDEFKLEKEFEFAKDNLNKLIINNPQIYDGNAYFFYNDLKNISEEYNVKPEILLGMITVETKFIPFISDKKEVYGLLQITSQDYWPRIIKKLEGEECADVEKFKKIIKKYRSKDNSKGWNYKIYLEDLYNDKEFNREQVKCHLIYGALVLDYKREETKNACDKWKTSDGKLCKEWKNINFVKKYYNKYDYDECAIKGYNGFTMCAKECGQVAYVEKVDYISKLWIKEIEENTITDLKSGIRILMKYGKKNSCNYDSVNTKFKTENVLRTILNECNANN